MGQYGYLDSRGKQIQEASALTAYANKQIKVNSAQQQSFSIDVTLSTVRKQHLYLPSIKAKMKKVEGHNLSDFILLSVSKRHSSTNTHQ